jgi:hypothetical protein
VRIERFHTSSSKKADSALRQLLAVGEPVMIYVDMGFLPYFDELPDDYHFGGHMVVVCGHDAHTDQVLIADRDLPLHSVSMDDLAQARGSSFKPFPPRNAWFTFDFSQKRQPRPEEVRQAILEVCTTMLEGPISNLGVRGIRKAAQRVLQWSVTMDEQELRWACFNIYIFIDAEGGTGGGIFRYMYGRFLEEAAVLLGDDRLAEVGEDIRVIGDLWQAAAEMFKCGSEAEDPVAVLGKTTAPLREIADLEQAAWERLRGYFVDQ